MSFEKEYFESPNTQKLYSTEQLDQMACVMLDGMIEDWEKNDPMWRVKEPFFSFHMNRFGSQESQKWPGLGRAVYQAVTELTERFPITVN